MNNPQSAFTVAVLGPFIIAATAACATGRPAPAPAPEPSPTLNKVVACEKTADGAFIIGEREKPILISPTGEWGEWQLPLDEGFLFDDGTEVYYLLRPANEEVSYLPAALRTQEQDEDQCWWWTQTREPGPPWQGNPENWQPPEKSGPN